MPIRKFISIGLLAATAICGQTSAAEVVIAAFNLAWAGTQVDFQRHVQVCSSPEVNWCNTRDRDKDAAQRCQQAFDHAVGGRDEALFVPPCNAYGLDAQSPRYDSELYAEKLDGLTNTIDRLISEQDVSVIAFQEVRSDEVLRVILGKHTTDFETCTAPHTTFQTVGFAWRKSLSSSPARCITEHSLSVLEKASARTRPGLALSLTVNGKNLSILNVHLKSSCANLFSTPKFQGHKLTDDNESCKTLNHQVVPLENWIEKTSEVSPLFIVVGDFNRRIDEENYQKYLLIKSG